MDKQENALPVVFSGEGRDYFGIWVVNLLLSVLTLGIYSAWAKVRRMHFFYRHTSLAGVAFDYHGEPLSILKGRTLAFLMFMAYQISAETQPMVAAIVLLVLMAVMPWLLHRSLCFRMHNSSYRGLRFVFRGSVRQAYVVFLGLPLLILASLGLAFPLWVHALKVYQYGSSAFGRSGFHCARSRAEIYRIYLVAGMVAIGVTVAITLLLGLGVAETLSVEEGAETRALAMVGGVALLAGFAMMLCVAPFVAAGVQNAVWNGLSLGPHRFCSAVSGRRLVFITLTNLLGVILTLGLYRPFAELRLMKYRLQSISMLPDGDLDDFVALIEADVAAIGEESAEMFDVDVGL